MDCGPTCLRMICKSYGKEYSRQYLRERSYLSNGGASFEGLAEAAEFIGMKSLAIKCQYQVLLKEVPLPCIAHWQQNHFIVVYKVTSSEVLVGDPGFGLISLKREEFVNGWQLERGSICEGLLLLLKPTKSFYEDNTENQSKSSGIYSLIPYLLPYSKSIVKLCLGLVIGSLIQLVFPFLTQALVDNGINHRSLSFVNLILIAQLTLFCSATIIEALRSWLLLYMTNRINLSLLSDFVRKIMDLPIDFFNNKTNGDLLQRIQDNSRIQDFLSASTLNILFSFFNLFLFLFILYCFNEQIFLLFLTASICYVLWVVAFNNKRQLIEYMRFTNLSQSQNYLIQIITAMQEIKLNNSESKRRKEWESVQIKLSKLSARTLSLSQWQNIGGTFIMTIANIIITFFAARDVIEGKITFGMMLSIQYILGQLVVPLNQFIIFTHSIQEARISLNRLQEVQNIQNEESPDSHQLKALPEYHSISIKNLSFRYGGENSLDVLKNVSFEIPKGRVTAIVGSSGSGKSTLIRLLLKFYAPYEGSIKLGELPLDDLSSLVWRRQCGVVMQDGFIFEDTIENNIAESSFDEIDTERLKYAVVIANLEEVIKELPMKGKTKIGSSGIGLSGGQAQRILIARAVYKNPSFLFFDEATSSLDATNEKSIMSKLENFYEGKTVVVVAHRLSTVKSADNIIVLDKGKVVEQGLHEQLCINQSFYYKLIKDQLQLGN